MASKSGITNQYCCNVLTSAELKTFFIVFEDSTIIFLLIYCFLQCVTCTHLLFIGCHGETLSMVVVLLCLYKNFVYQMLFYCCDE